MNRQWQPRARRFALYLLAYKARPPMEMEKEFRDENPDPWDYFQVFGIQPETQGYVRKTLEYIEELDLNSLGDQLTAEIRLDWSAEELLWDPEKKKRKWDAIGEKNRKAMEKLRKESEHEETVAESAAEN